MKQWFVIYSKPSQERIAEGNLQAQGFETYLPRLAQRKTHARRSSVVTVPMFPRYFFVRGARSMAHSGLPMWSRLVSARRLSPMR